MRKYDQMIVCRVPRDIREKTRQMCREMNKNESVVLREGLMNTINQWEMNKREQEMLKSFMTS